MKRQTTEWDKILANHTSYKGFVSRIHKKFSKPKIKRKIIFKVKMI